MPKYVVTCYVSFCFECEVEAPTVEEATREAADRCEEENGYGFYDIGSFEVEEINEEE